MKFENWNEVVDKNAEVKMAVTILKIIQSLGYEALIVGGTPRDLLLGRTDINDVDISTNAPMDSLEQHFSTHSIGKNKDFNVVVVDVEGFSFEIAGYRADLYDSYAGGVGATQSVRVNDFEADSSRRDFLMNSLGIDADGNIVDHHGGLQDIQNKIITAVGDPDMRFKEDLIRPLRAIRQASKLGFTIETNTMEAIRRNAPDIVKVAPERITKELLKICEMSGDKVADAIILLDESDLLRYILPEIDQMKKFDHNPDYHPEGSVFYHSLGSLRAYKGSDPCVAMACLFHDVGKLVTWSEGNHYYKHELKGVEVFEKIAERMKLTNDMRDAVTFAISNHMLIHNFLNLKNNTIFKLMQNKHWPVLIAVAEADSRSRLHKFDQDEWDSIMHKIDGMGEKWSNAQAMAAIKKKVNGSVVISLRGFSPKTEGPKIGKVIKDTIDWILDNNINIEDTGAIEDYIMGVEV